jgi:hypothetical protein
MILFDKLCKPFVKTVTTTTKASPKRAQAILSRVHVANVQNRQATHERGTGFWSWQREHIRLDKWLLEKRGCTSKRQRYPSWLAPCEQ